MTNEGFQSFLYFKMRYSSNVSSFIILKFKIPFFLVVVLRPLNSSFYRHRRNSLTTKRRYFKIAISWV